jgi:hypothetical protein
MESFLPLFLALPSFRAAAASRGNSLRGNDVPPCEAPAAPTMPAHRSSSVATFAKTSLDGPVEIPRAPWEREFFGVNLEGRKAGKQTCMVPAFLPSKWIRHSFDPHEIVRRPACRVKRGAIVRRKRTKVPVAHAGLAVSVVATTVPGWSLAVPVAFANPFH